MNHRLQQAIEMAQAGQRQEARLLLQQILVENPSMVTAWLWLATVAVDDDERISALQRVMELDPENNTARVALERLGVLIDETPPPNQRVTWPSVSDTSLEGGSFLSRSELVLIVAIIIVGIMVISGLLIAREVGGLGATPTPPATLTSTPRPTFTPSMISTPRSTNTPPPIYTLPPPFTPTPADVLPSRTPSPTPTPIPIEIFGG